MQDIIQKRAEQKDISWDYDGYSLGKHGSSGGCNAGFSALMLIAVFALVKSKREI